MVQKYSSDYGQDENNLISPKYEYSFVQELEMDIRSVMCISNMANVIVDMALVL